MDEIIITADGGCLGNGAPEARCYYSFAVHYRGELKHRVMHDLPQCHTAPEAEYEALISALVYLKSLEIRAPRVGQIPVIIRMDCQQVVSQVDGDWKVAAKFAERHQCAKNMLVTLRRRFNSLTLVRIDDSEVKAILGH